jgi:hypothetical protein
MPAVTARRFYLPFYICVCLPLSVSMITSKLSNVLIRKFVDLISHFPIELRTGSS